MKRNLYLSILTIASFVMVFQIGTAKAQEWSIYDANVFPNESVPAFSTSSGSFEATENVIIDDADMPDNKLLQMDVSGNPQNAFLWRMNFASQDIAVTDLTVVMRVKANPDRDLAIDLDMHYSDIRSRITIHTATNLFRIRNGSGDNVTLDASFDATTWNTYRFTMTATETNVYLNEDPTPVLTFTPASSSSGNRHFRFGDGDSGATFGADIDWVVWDVTGAYAPGEGAAIPDPVVTPSWNADLDELNVDAVGIENFSADMLDYEVVLPVGTTDVPVVTAVASDSEATVLITPATEIPGSTTILVTAENGITTKTYTIDFRIIADVATLQEIAVDGVTLADFDPDVFTYNVTLPLETTVDVPEVTAVATGPNATVVVTPATELPGQTTIVVTAEDGIAEVTYTVNFVMVSVDATLSDISADDATITGFDPEVLDYNIFYPVGTTEIPVITATTTNENATLVITQATEFPGVATIVVTAEDGETELTYTINLLTGSNDATLADLMVDGVTIDGFDADVLEYFLVYPVGTTDVPVITAEATDANAEVVVTAATEIPGVTTIVVTAEDNFTVLTYTVNIRNISDNANLDDLQINETTVDGFDPDLLTYDVELPAGTVDIPVVAAVAANENAEVVIDQATELPGTATVVVSAEDDVTEKTYTINFTVEEGPLTWRVYDATNLPTDQIPVFRSSNTGGAGATNTIVADPDDATNFLLEFITAEVGDNYMWATDLQDETPAVTFVWRAKAANDVSRRVMEFDIHHNGIRERVYINREENRVRLNQAIGGGDGGEIPAPEGVSLSDWNTYRLTKSEGDIKLYLNEDPTPIAEGTTTTSTSQQYFRFGDGNGSHNSAALIDWIIWDETGAYAPGEGSPIPSNVVTPNWDATLSELMVDGTLITGFEPDSLDYDIILPDGTTDIPVISAAVNYPDAQMVVTQATELPGVATVEVTAVNGFTINTYNVALRFISSNTELAEITVGTEPLADFAPDVLVYDVVLPEGTTEAPEVSALAADANATVLITQADALPGAATIEVTAEDGTTIETYTINFTISTSVSELNEIGFRMYPNPASSQLTLEWPQSVQGRIVQVININGQVVLHQEASSRNEILDISALEQGVYILQIVSDHKQARELFIKQ